MAGRRKYDDGCAVAHGLDLIGERWALLVVRELLLGPKRFTDLRAGIPGASADMLTQRLRELSESGVVRRRRLAPPAGSWVYELTAWGAELEPIVTRLGRWSSRSPRLRRDAAIGVDSLVLSLKALFDPEAAQGFDAVVALRLGEDRFLVEIAGGRLGIARGQTERADATIAADPDTLSALLYGDLPVADAVRAGHLVLDDPGGLVERFLRLFPLPEPAALPNDAG
ncbi:winged helix-turn-helix transcriptional regulator [Nonomuraea dietziae]|uniref:DNA-binding HxlR family transcriptional regulator n=1 Tax=Nonomuraea dietziae TaxID=65515 RepID=A0A7W5V1J8_9ACTN|nr:winged helix-turn-helix transcriptional regulator [Nonomuraea dietziae]MBB3726011.1 DNA-binding HxlR family transcriptional regulator [Nonomuraea dietziae]